MRKSGTNGGGGATMRLWRGVLQLLLLLLLHVGVNSVREARMVCFYDASSILREGPAQLSVNELEPALQFCNYLVYGYAGIDRDTFQLKPLNPSLDINRDHYRTITTLKRKYPQLRVLLSVGGDRDIDIDGDETSNKYLTLLEEGRHRQAFVESVVSTLRDYKFDGVDLAWQFPKNHPKKVRSGLKKAWSTFKGWFTSSKAVDEKADDHKMQFTALVRELRAALRSNTELLTLTMLPHVDATLFIDIFVVTANVEFVNLATFDFQTPIRDPKVADHPAPLYEMYERDPNHNVNAQVQIWLNNTAAANLLNIGVPAFGRAWVMSTDSGITGFPPIPDTFGAASGGRQTVTPGLLSWPEICEKLHNKKELTGEEAPLRKVGDPTHRFGTYAYRAADDNGEDGLWVGYEDPASASTKASYVQAKGLGGVALFDLSLDDFRGQCAGEKFPILRSIKYKM